jgi:hypothetical protein
MKRKHMEHLISRFKARLYEARESFTRVDNEYNFKKNCSSIPTEEIRAIADERAKLWAYIEKLNKFNHLT